MDIREYVRIWRARWVSILVTVVVALGGAVLVSAATTPQYEGSSQLFVTTTGGASVSEAYQGNLFAKERVTSYAALAAGKQVAQRTIDTLGIDTTADELISSITAVPEIDSVLLDIAVLNPNPELARDLANTVAAQTSQLVSELETSARGGTPAASATLVQLSDVPSSPVTPQWIRNLLLGVVAGLLVGLIVAVLRDRLDNSVKTPESLAELAGAPAVGAIPVVKIKNDMRPLLFGPDHPAQSEAFRDLRTNLSFVGSTKEARVLVFTAPFERTGSTTTVASLGVSLGEVGNSVLLIDADLRTPALAPLFGVLSKVGLSNVLAGQEPLHESIQKTQHLGVSVLPSGEVPPNPSELLSTEILADLLKDVRNSYDFVLIDTSPVLPTTDAALLAKSADGALLVSRYGKTKRGDIGKAAEKLQFVEATVLGSILTAARVKRS